MRRPFLTVATLCTLLAGAPAALAAQVVTSTLPEFNGAFHDTGFPQPPVTVGTFTFAPPAGTTIMSAILSGTFSNSQSSSTAGVDLFVGDVLVAQCVRLASCYFNPESFSFTFTPEQFALFASGTATLTAVQTSESYIRLGPATLTITYAPVTSVVPEPATMTLLASGLFGLGGVRVARRRRGRA
jgi:hypothetical protein